MADDTDRNQSWSAYWSSGALHSCVGSFAGNYAGEIAQFWRHVALRQGAHARVLDIATGNGALPRLLLEATVDTHALQIDAIDLAQLSPRWAQAQSAEVRSRLRFHSGVRAEALPFADTSFELVISQYGLEYTDLDGSLAEIRRVLAPGGAIALVLHHHESLPVRLGRAEIVELDRMLGADDLIERARAMLPFMARLATPAGLVSVRADPAAAHCRNEFNACMRALEDRAASAPDAASLLLEVQATVGRLVSTTPQLGLAAASKELNSTIAQLRESRLRQIELVGCALDSQALRALTTRLCGALPCSIDVGTVAVEGHLFGWTLQITQAGKSAHGG
jgi:ubiquinone/menaquinone biosynthesis C-methylase UbiE